MSHIAQGTLEAYVTCSLTDVECAEVEAHVASCAPCAARLSREARYELAFAEVAARAERPRRSISLMVPAAGALAMAAAVLLWMVPRESVEQRSQNVDDPTPAIADTSADASTFTASLEVQVDGSRVGVRD